MLSNDENNNLYYVQNTQINMYKAEKEMKTVFSSIVITLTDTISLTYDHVMFRVVFTLSHTTIYPCLVLSTSDFVDSVVTYLYRIPN